VLWYLMPLSTKRYTYLFKKKKKKILNLKLHTCFHFCKRNKMIFIYFFFNTKKKKKGKIIYVGNKIS
jgi:hypothetical protein